MKRPLLIREIEVLAEDHSTETIREQYGDRLDEEGLAFLSELDRIGAQLDNLEENLRPLIGEPPRVPLPPPTPWWRGSLAIPNPLALGAVLLMGFLFWNWLEQEPEAVPDDFMVRRSGPPASSPQLEILDKPVFEAHMARGRYYADQGGKENQEAAYEDFRQAWLADPHNIEVLRELVMICETLKLKDQQAFFVSKLEHLESSGDLEKRE